MRHRPFILPLVLALGLVAGCDSAAAPKQLPAAGKLVAASATSLSGLKSVRFDFGIHGTIPGFPVRSASGVAHSDGRATGTVDLQHGVQHTEYRFTLDSTTVRLRSGADKASTRGVPRRYTPGRLLNSADGIRSLLSKASGLRTETTEELHGTATFRVTGKLDKAVLAQLIPGVWADAVVKFWIAKNPGRTLRRIWIQLPPRQPNAGVVSMELALSKHNAVPEQSLEPTTSAPGPSSSGSAG